METLVSVFAERFVTVLLTLPLSGPASDKIAEVVGPRHYNLRVTYYLGSAAPLEDLGVITEGGARVQLKGLSVYSVEKITDQQFEEMQNDFDPIEAPPGPYKLQPEKKG